MLTPQGAQGMEVTAAEVGMKGNAEESGVPALPPSTHSKLCCSLGCREKLRHEAMCWLGPGNALRWETQLGSREFLRHPKMVNQVLTLWETGFWGFLSEAHIALLCRPHSAFRVLQILDSPG